MRDLPVEEFNRSLAEPANVLKASPFFRRRIVSFNIMPALASYAVAYVAQRAECALEDAAAMPEQEFLAAAKPLLDFLDARWPPG